MPFENSYDVQIRPAANRAATLTQCLRFGSGRQGSSPARSRCYADATQRAGSCLFHGHLALAGLDLDDDRQDHRAPLEALVDELGDVVVEVVLEEVDLRDLLLRRVRE